MARRTGLSAEVIRAWEQRHGVVAPSRTQSGRRLYTESDIERLGLLRKAVQMGRGIGQVAGLTQAQLRALVADDAATADAAHPGALEAVTLREAHAAVRVLDAQRLGAVLRTAALSLPVARLVDGVLAPLMRDVGVGWEERRLTVGHEHLATAVLRAVVASLPVTASPVASAPTVVVAAPSGHRHELGAMAAAVVALADGWRVLYLGPDTPSADIARTAAAAGAAAIAISLTYPHGDAGVAADLRALRERAPGVAVLAGGMAVPSYRDALAEIGAQPVTDIEEFRRIMTSLARASA